MIYFTRTLMMLLSFVCYFVGYLIFANPWVSLAMLVCFWIGAIMAVIMED